MASKLSKEVAQVKKAIRMLQDAQLELIEVRNSLRSMGYGDSGNRAQESAKLVEIAENATVELWQKLQ